MIEETAALREPRLLDIRQTVPVMEAISEIACDETIVLLGRIASSDSVLARRAFEALEGIDNPRARRLTEILTVQGRRG